MVKQLLFLLSLLSVTIKDNSSMDPKLSKCIPFGNFTQKILNGGNASTIHALLFLDRQNARYTELWGIVDDVIQANKKIVRKTTDVELKTKNPEMFLWKPFLECTQNDLDDLKKQINNTFSWLEDLAQKEQRE